ncbi:hypothetical protein [Agrobacterium sp. NPDC090273]
MNRSANRRPRAIALARVASETAQITLRLTMITTGALAALAALLF